MRRRKKNGAGFDLLLIIGVPFIVGYFIGKGGVTAPASNTVPPLGA